MGRDKESVLGGPAIILLAAGAILDIILFYFMFKFANEENLFMVILSAMLIGVVAIGVAKGFVAISRNKYSK